LLNGKKSIERIIPKASGTKNGLAKYNPEKTIKRKKSIKTVLGKEKVVILIGLKIKPSKYTTFYQLLIYTTA
jgi:hypothetical protein